MLTRVNDRLKGQVMIVAVGSSNPVKIEATKIAFGRVWPKQSWEVIGKTTPSSVSDQPMSDEETMRGAINRAKYLINEENVDYCVGIEGGVQQIGSHWFGCGFVAIIRKQDGILGLGTSARVIIAPKMVDKLEQGYELGSVADELFGTKNVKQQVGHFGLMTNGLITRKDAYVDGIIFGLTRFLQPNIFV